MSEVPLLMRPGVGTQRPVQSLIYVAAKHSLRLVREALTMSLLGFLAGLRSHGVATTFDV